MRRIFTLSFLLIYGAASAQYARNYKAEGDKAFRNKDYYEAAHFYLKAAEGANLVETKPVQVPYLGNNSKKTKVQLVTDKSYISYQLAESYRLYENYVEAEPWYYQVLNDSKEASYPLTRLWYGICLRANQRFDDAIKQLSLFEKAYTGDAKNLVLARKEIDNCRFAKEQYAYPVLIDAAQLKGEWNSDGSNYATIHRDENVWFTSSRQLKNDKRHLNRIYHLTSGTSAKPDIISFKDDDNQKEVEYGTPALNPLGNKLYFTRWYKEGSKTVHAIYRSDRVNDNWSKPVKLNANVNAGGFNAIQPFITADGKRMFFVSNKPGGHGGSDIWVSTLDDEGDPINSVNLGPAINTAMDEQAPYFNEEGKRLVYSSKGFTGLGGFDFFESYGGEDNWTLPRNMGYPVNSAKDDLYYSPDHRNSDKFYISSDRESDCCLDLFAVVDQRFFIKGHLLDCETQKPLAGAVVSLVDSLSKKTVKQVTLGSNGEYNFKITTKRPYSLLFEKAEYFTKTLMVPLNPKIGTDTLFNPDLCLQPYVVGKPMVIKNILYDYNVATLRPESKIVLNGVVDILNDNPKLKVELSAHTDSVGGEAYNQKLSQERAQSCVDYVISKGIAADRIFARGYGELRPIAPNSLPNGKDNPEGRQENRRTEFTVLKTDITVFSQSTTQPK